MRLAEAWRLAFIACQTAAMLPSVPGCADVFISPLLEVREHERKALEALLEFMHGLGAEECADEDVVGCTLRFG